MTQKEAPCPRGAAHPPHPTRACGLTGTGAVASQIAPAPYWAGPARVAVGTAAVPAPAAPLLEWPQCPDLRPGWRVSIHSQPTRAPRDEAMALGPPRGRGPARAAAQGPRLQWGVGGITGGTAAAALRLPLALGAAGTVAGGPPPSRAPPPHKGQQGPGVPAGDARCLPRERGGRGTRATLPPTPTPGPQRPGLAPCRPAARLFCTWRVDQEVVDGDEAEDGDAGTRPQPPLPPLRNTSGGTTASPLVRWWYRQAALVFPSRPQRWGWAHTACALAPLVGLLPGVLRLQDLLAGAWNGWWRCGHRPEDKAV